VKFQPRNEPKTRRFMLDEGLNTEDVFATLERLKAEEYYRSPTNDRDGTAGSVMEFTHPYSGKMLYIKLKLWTDSEGDAGSVMSFHEEGMYV
jgi:hypothetical protein